MKYVREDILRRWAKLAEMTTAGMASGGGVARPFKPVLRRVMPSLNKVRRK